MTELDAPLYRWIRDLSRGVSESPERERFADAANAVESALAEGAWLLGRQFTVTDVVCVSVLAGANSRDLLAEWPGCALTSSVARRARRTPARLRSGTVRAAEAASEQGAALLER
jgi:glutathione S-transferase